MVKKVSKHYDGKGKITAVVEETVEEAPAAPVKKTSMILGIVSLCLCWIPFVNLASIVMSIVGLCIKKENKTRDMALNVLALVFALILNSAYMSYFGYY